MQDEFIRLQALLHKTIVFITHDFDEAIRLADRIAVMKDGEVIQIATPEQLVLNPATDYVEEFTRHIPRSKIVTIGSIMSSVKVAVGEKILASATVDEVSRTVVESKQALPVVNPEDQIIGSIGREAVINVLVNGELN
jgi:glycine betaine/proline transport system ATP-binding protein